MKESYIIEFPKIVDCRGNLSFIEQGKHIPFCIARSYWVYDVPGGCKRGGHAFHQNEECLVSLSGSFDVVLISPDGVEKRWHMNRSYYGLYVPNGYWRELDNFSTNSLALVLASMPYSPDDYIRDFEQFRREGK